MSVVQTARQRGRILVAMPLSDDVHVEKLPRQKTGGNWWREFLIGWLTCVRYRGDKQCIFAFRLQRSKHRVLLTRLHHILNSTTVCSGHHGCRNPGKSSTCLHYLLSNSQLQTCRHSRWNVRISYSSIQVQVLGTYSYLLLSPPALGSHPWHVDLS